VSAHYPVRNTAARIEARVIMGSWLSTFQRLRWKLTLRSMLVTVGALLVVVLILGGLLLSRVLLPLDILSTQVPPATWIQVVRNDMPYLVRHILSQDPVDTELIQLLLAEGELQISFFDLLHVGDLELRLRTVGKGSSLLLDSEGTLLGTSNPHFVSPNEVGRPLDPSILPGLEGPLEAALKGELNPDRLFVTIEPNEEFFFTVPVMDRTNQDVLGVRVVYIEHLPTEAALSSNLLSVLGRSALILVVSAALVSLLFGFLTARGMVDRLQRASEVTDAWSKGDFSEFIEDPIQDEIGQLGQRLNRMALQLKELLRRREQTAVMEERNRLARDLHDSAKQQALAASFQIGTALTLYDREPEAARSHLEEAERLVDNVREELTDLIMELRPQDFEDKRIGEILTTYVIDWSQQHEFKVEQDLQTDIPLSISAKQTLLRILQEALANVARHSLGTQVSIRLESRADEVTLTVQDNGVGFAPDNGTHGVGIHSMRERAESLGGNLELTSVPEEGTTVCIRIPQAR
jgi:signal transduction histidine kinase